MTHAGTLLRPPQLRELGALQAMASSLDRAAVELLDRAGAVGRQVPTLAGSWTSPASTGCVTRLADIQQQLETSGRELDALRPQVRRTVATLEAADVTFRRLQSQLYGISPAMEPAMAAEIRQGVHRRYQQLLAECEAAERSLEASASDTYQRLGIVTQLLGAALHGSWLGAVLAGAPTTGFITKRVLSYLEGLEANRGTPPVLIRPAAWANRLLDRVRAPAALAPGAGTPAVSTLRRLRGYGRAPVLQTILHERIAASRRQLSPATLQRLGDAGRYGRHAGRFLGVAGAALTVASLPGSYGAARDQHLAAGYSTGEARVRATEDVAFRTVGEVGGAVVGAKGGAALGATIGSFVAPGVGTVVGGVLGGAIGAFAGSAAGGWVGDQAKGAFRAAREGVGNAASSVADAAGSAANTIVNAAGTATEAVSNVASAVTSTVSGAADAATSAVSNVAGGAKNAVGSLVKRIF